MNVTVRIPDDIAARLCAASRSKGSRLRNINGHISKAGLRRLLGFGTRYRLDGFLKAHKVFEDYTLANFEQDREDLHRLGF